MFSRSHIYDNWERLVAAVLRRDELWRLFHEDSRSPSIRSEASSSSFSSSNYSDVPFAYTAPYQKPNLVFVADNTPDFELEDLVGASAKFLGKGMFGNAYTAAMNNGIKIFVKELKSVDMSEAEFKRRMDILGCVKHENVVPLKAYFYSKEEKLMLYDYYSNGSVYDLLHGRANVDWETRVRIALGAARGIAHIHSSQMGKKPVHGNIKSSNILLNSQMYWCVSDFGLAGIMMDKSFAHTARYHAPEVKITQDVSQESDVYSFGILLLELLTRKSPVPTSTNHEAVDLASWVNSFRRKDWIPKVIGADLIIDNPNMKNDLIKLVELGIKCVAKAPKKRPKMTSVVKKIKDIQVVSPINAIPTAVKPKALVFLDDGDNGFDLEDLLEASAEVLGSRGTFGRSYKVILEEGTVIKVKRLRDVVATREEFAKHMEVLGRIRHINVAPIKAYYYSKDEMILVYDYFEPEKSLSGLLHGENKSFLDWEARLKIAVGAARGISHIHKQDNQKLVHGNMKSSNIFLSSRNFGCVAEAGLGAVVSSLISIPSFYIMVEGYRAPEVTDTRTVTQASDIYAFGVILIELVSGKRPQVKISDGGSLVLWFESVNREEWANEVYDPELMKQENDQVSISQVLYVALDCVARVPEHRPKMAEVVKMLEEISVIDAEEDDPKDPNVTRLEDLLPKLTVL